MATFTMASAIVAFGVWPADPPGAQQTALTGGAVEIADSRRSKRTAIEVPPTDAATPGAARDPAGAARPDTPGLASKEAGSDASSVPSSGESEDDVTDDAPGATSPPPAPATPVPSSNRGPLSGLGHTLDETTRGLGSTLRALTDDLGSGLDSLSPGLGAAVAQAGDGLALTVEKLGSALAALLGHVPPR